MKKEVCFYRDLKTGREPAKEWLLGLDIITRSRIDVRLDRIQIGNLGDYKSLGAGLFELRFHFGPGYRVYFGMDGESLILLLFGGNKANQLKDINKAFSYWRVYLEEKGNA